MHWLAWIVALLALIEGGWLAFDGGHALATGDYVSHVIERPISR